MRNDLLAWVARAGGIVTRAETLSRFAAHVVDDAIQAGALVRLLPAVYGLPDLPHDRRMMRRAALLYRPDGALSHLDALDEWGLATEGVASGPISLLTDDGHREAHVAGVVVHRRRGFCNAPPHVVTRGGLRLVKLETAVVDSWAGLPLSARRAPALVAVRERRTTAARLLDALRCRGRVAGAAQMRTLFALIDSGCHSELELWGHERVFSTPGLCDAVAQFRISAGGRTAYLDRYFEAEMLAIELDGAAFHGAPGQRERDIRRDAWLATLGIQTLRFAHPRLFGDVDGVRREIFAIRSTRRAQLRGRSA